jgi:hypothetical protein
MEYDDGRVACGENELVIRWYYFPAGTKRIPYAKIREVRPCPPSRGRIWGSNDLIHWYNLDPHRGRKDTGLVIHAGRLFKPVITPDDPDRVVAALTRHGVTVTG